MDAAEIDADVAAAQRGDREAFRRLVLTLQRDVRLFIAARAAGLELVEEVLQQTFVTAFAQLARYEPRGTFAAWLKGIARNALRQAWRERRRSVELHHAERGAVDHPVDAGEVDDGEADRALARLRTCLAALPERERLLLRRRYAEGVELGRLAQHFKRSKENLSLILHRLRANLRQCMARDGT